ncbi:MAG TPA: helix-turn-helix domain-containing protein [Candidatus Saccharimonadales bacterium]|nr:helix-turn-helix domain-containing protein [Candidatus Saccharimonadales bacterium]
MELVTSTRLADKLRITADTLAQWRRVGFLAPAETINNTNHYKITNVDEILQRGATNLNHKISAKDVLWGKVVLLPIGDAAEKLGTSTNALRHRIERGRFGAIKLLSEWRVLEADVDRFLMQANNPDYISREEVAHIFGSRLDYVKERIQSGELRCVTIPGKPIRRPVTLESILALLQKLIPKWVDAKEWIAERKKDERPLIGLREFERFLGLSANTGQNVLKDGRIAYLQTEGGLIKISPVSANRLLDRQTPLNVGQVAAIFGVDEDTAAKAWQSGDLECTLHHHSDKKLRQACVVEMLRDCLSPGVTQRIKWCEQRLRDPSPLLSVAEAAAFFDVSEKQVTHFLQSGKLRGVKLPGRTTEWHIAKDMR